MMNISDPMAPNKCIGLLNRERNQMVNLESIDETFHPKFGFPIFSSLVLHHFFSDFSKTAFFAKTGMYRCISPETSMFFTIFL
jgi:hypothetical protein